MQPKPAALYPGAHAMPTPEDVQPIDPAATPEPAEAMASPEAIELAGLPEPGDLQSWEEPLSRLLSELSETQEALLDVLDRKREMLVKDDRAGLAGMQPEEERLAERLQACQDRRQELLATASEQGLPDRDLRSLAKALPAPTRDAIAPRVQSARSRARVLQHQGLANWVLVQRRLLHLSQMIEIVATGGQAAPTYDPKGSPAAGGVLVDRAV